MFRLVCCLLVCFLLVAVLSFFYLVYAFVIIKLNLLTYFYKRLLEHIHVYFSLVSVSSSDILLLLGVNPQIIRGSKTGVFVSQSQSESYVAWTDDVENVSGYEMIGCILSMAANRLSYFFDFRGGYCI